MAILADSSGGRYDPMPMPRIKRRARSMKYSRVFRVRSRTREPVWTTFEERFKSKKDEKAEAKGRKRYDHLVRTHGAQNVEYVSIENKTTGRKLAKL